MLSTSSAVCTVADFLSFLLSSQGNPESFCPRDPDPLSMISYGRGTAPTTTLMHSAHPPRIDLSQLGSVLSAELQPSDVAQDNPPSEQSELIVKLVCRTGAVDQTFRFPLNPELSGKQHDEAIRAGLTNALNEIARKLKQDDKDDTQESTTSSCIVIFPKSDEVEKYASLLPVGFRGESFEANPVSPSQGHTLKNFMDKLKDGALLLGGSWVLVDIMLRRCR
jgi:hypothetical protein